MNPIAVRIARVIAAIGIASSLTLTFSSTGAAALAPSSLTVKVDNALVVAPSAAKTASVATIKAAIKAASKRKPAALVKLLAGASGNKTRVELRKWLVKRGDFKWVAKFKKKSISIRSYSASSLQLDKASARATCTKPYACTCTSYAGQRMSWSGKVILACHGWYDEYVSGRHVAHAIVDLVPRGEEISVACAKGAVGVVISVGGVVASLPMSPVGWMVAGGSLAWALKEVVLAC